MLFSYLSWQNTPPDGGYFSSIDPSDVFCQNSDNNTDHVDVELSPKNVSLIDADHVDDNYDNNNDNNLDNFVFGKAAVGINEDDEAALDADYDFDADEFGRFEEISLDGVTNNSSEANIDDYARLKEKEVEQLVKVTKDSSEVCQFRNIYNKDGYLESQTYDRNILTISHGEMARCVENGGQKIFDEAMARKQTSVSIVLFLGRLWQWILTLRFIWKKRLSVGPVTFGNEQKKNPYHKENARHQSDEQPPPIEPRYLPAEFSMWSAAQRDRRLKGCYGHNPRLYSSILNFGVTFDPSPLDNRDWVGETPTFNDLNRWQHTTPSHPPRCQATNRSHDR